MLTVKVFRSGFTRQTTYDAESVEIIKFPTSDVLVQFKAYNSQSGNSYEEFTSPIKPHDCKKTIDTQIDRVIVENEKGLTIHNIYATNKYVKVDGEYLERASN